MLKRFLPKERRFFELFNQLAVKIQEGLALFDEMLHDFTTLKAVSAQIKAIEHEADLLVHEVFKLLNNTFVTPFDREDIQLLVRKLDDVLDLVEATVLRLDIYDIEAPTDEIKEMAGILRRSFALVASAISQLDNAKYREKVLGLCVEVNSLENDCDQVLHKALRRLFTEQTDPIYIIKMKEIIENLEVATDRCEDLADVCETILLKNS